MLWQEEGIVLATRRHGESSLVVNLLTPSHGRHAGLVRGGAGRKARPLYQVGNRLQVAWRARLAEQLGSFSAELLVPTAARVMDDPDRLAALGSACALLQTTLPERDPHPRLYNRLAVFTDMLIENAGWLGGYVRFELALLADLGFGLDLTACAVTGRSEDLAYVSPRTGRAVSRSAAAPYESRLLPLPGFLVGQDAADLAQIGAGLRLTGAFLERHLFMPHDRSVPNARQLLLDRLTRHTLSGKA
jgi:DNA repair protein RecO (recombination protein O)